MLPLELGELIEQQTGSLHTLIPVDVLRLLQVPETQLGAVRERHHVLARVVPANLLGHPLEQAGFDLRFEFGEGPAEKDRFRPGDRQAVGDAIAEQEGALAPSGRPACEELIDLQGVGA